MSWLSRLNEKILKRVRPEIEAPVAWPEGLEMPDGTMLQYSSLVRAVATSTANIVGETLCLVLDFGEGWVVTVSEDQVIWQAVVDALDHHPRRRPSADGWKRRLMLAGDGHLEIDLLD